MTRCWFGVADADPFGVDNLPYGTVLWPDGARGLAARIGDFAMDVGAIGGPISMVALLAAGPDGWAATRSLVTRAVTDEARRPVVEPSLYPLEDVSALLPFEVTDFTDFFASEHHAANAGRIFRPGGEPLTPNWKHQPLGYHGRSGTVVVSGTDIVRPTGQYRDGEAVVVDATRRLDIEAEVGFVVGVGNQLGTPVPVADFARHVFGVCLVNDWSARDLQAFESAPLGPFLGKSFATSVSGWVTPLAALEQAGIAPPAQQPVPPDYLRAREHGGLDLALEVRLNGELIASPPFSAMYWTPAQLLAHLTVNGAAVRPGDLFASGTVSGPAPTERGCLLELTWGGTQPLSLTDGTNRAFLEDGDEVVITASAPAPSGRLGLGEVRGRILPARKP